jgi:single-stranded-DNA-specific exonuclease
LNNNIEAKASVNGFLWNIHNTDEALVELLRKKLDISEIIARLLVVKGVSLEEASGFLKPTLRESMPDPFHLLDMEKATDIICASVIAKEKIVIFGDYDVDGATSSALLKRFFTLLGVETEVYIPDRIGEGYGPTIESFTLLKERGTDLIITVDCGTSSFDAIEYGVNNGIKIIVIDHHLSGEVLPPAHAIVNPSRFDETSEYTYLAAVGVAFLLSVAITSVLRKNNYFLNIKEPDLIKLLDIVAIGTICDVVPLKSLNRAFVIQGLKILNKRQNPGVLAFCKLLNLDNELGTYHLGYVIGPRINAGGRVGESFLGSKLLSTDNEEEAFEVVQKLDQYNQERRAIESNVYDQALEQANKLSPDDSFILVSGEKWHPGVVGIVAGRLKEKLNKSVAVISLEGDKAKASCRAINGNDFGTAIVKAKEEGLLLSGGGHKMAAGFTALAKDLPAIKSFLHNRFSKELALITNKGSRYFDAYLTTQSINIEFAKQLEKLGPFGPSNHEPRFVLKNVYVARFNIFGVNHVSCFISCAESKSLVNLLKANAFRAADSRLGEILVENKRKIIDLVGCIRINRWKGRETSEFIIDDAIITSNNYN